MFENKKNIYIVGNKNKDEFVSFFEQHFAKEQIEVLQEDDFKAIPLSQTRRVVVVLDVPNGKREMYLQLFSRSNEHLSTIFNADDKNSVKLASEALVKRGRIYYHTQRSELEEQSLNIGGAFLKDGEISCITAKTRELTRAAISPQLPLEAQMAAEIVRNEI